MASTEAPISITVKSAAGSLVTVRAETGAELDTIIAEGLDAIASAAMELEKAIRGNTPAPMTTKAVAAALGATIIDSPVGGGRNCPHGKMTAIQGTGKDGSMYRGYFCPAPKGSFDKCKNVYLKTTDAAWNTFVPEQVK